mgnify:CR=1 FL=1
MKTQFNNMNLYMKNVYEKEKKLIQALEKLDTIKIENPNSIEKMEMLENQKNQLEIEKNEIENKYLNLKEEYSKIKMKLEQVSSKKIGELNKETDFKKKIDELNQETDNLLDEIDKWQM